MQTTTPCYMAARFKGLAEHDGWPPTGAALDFQALPIGGKNEPPNRAAYGETQNVKFGASRDFEGVNSSGGPQTAVRPDFTDVTVERESDILSPYLYQYCLDGRQLEWVHLIQILPDGRDANGDVIAGARPIHIRLNDVQVTGYELVGERFFGQRVEPTRRFSIGDGSIAFERVTLLYTRMSIKVGTTEHGWDTGTNEAWTSS